MAEFSPSFSIVIPTYNAGPYLSKQLGVLLPLIEHVILLDSSSKDDTKGIAQEYGVRFVDIPLGSFDHGGTRSLAKEICNSEIIVFLTQDALPLSTDDIYQLIAVFQNEAVGAAYGRQIPYTNSSAFGSHLRVFNYGSESYVRNYSDRKVYGIKTAFLSNSFSAYRRSAMDKAGWFKNGLILGEDTYAGARLLQEGFKLAYIAEAQVYHSHSYTVFEEFKRYFDIGVFHRMESWLLKEFGKPEGEGMRYIRSELNYLIHNKFYSLIPLFFIRNVMKFLGYKMGWYYQYLPKRCIKVVSMHGRWWDKYWSRSI